MPLVSSKNMLVSARKGGYAIGSFNIFNMESAKAIVAAAEREEAPVMLQIWSGFESFIGLDVLGAIAVCEAKRAKVPVAVHLDHGATLSQVGQSIAAGFTSVMIDGSSLPLDKNIRLTRTVADVCRGLNIPVEGEIGHVGGSEGGQAKDEIIYTDPDEALRFYQETGADYIAVSIGTCHGVYRDKPKLNIPLLRKIAEKVDAPLVLHGSSYTPEDMLAEAVGEGISKINVATEISDVMIKSTIEHVKTLESAKYSNELTDVPYAKMTEMVRHKIRLFGGSGKAAI